MAKMPPEPARSASWSTPEGEVWKNERFPNYWNEGLPYLG